TSAMTWMSSNCAALRASHGPRPASPMVPTAPRLIAMTTPRPGVRLRPTPWPPSPSRWPVTGWGWGRPAGRRSGPSWRRASPEPALILSVQAEAARIQPQVLGRGAKLRLGAEDMIEGGGRGRLVDEGLVLQQLVAP